MTNYWGGLRRGTKVKLLKDLHCVDAENFDKYNPVREGGDARSDADSGPRPERE